MPKNTTDDGGPLNDGPGSKPGGKTGGTPTLAPEFDARQIAEPWIFGPTIPLATVIETGDDSPVLLRGLLESDSSSHDDGAGLQITRIDGVGISATEPTPLPGIRVGSGEGTGFVFRRALDGELVFTPDADYKGITTFAYTVVDAHGDQATALATVSVSSTNRTGGIAFADGTNWASVSEGIDAAILGALTFGPLEAGNQPEYRIFEGDETTPSRRFGISGDKLKVLQPLDYAVDGTVVLRIVANDDGQELGASEFVIDVRPIGTAQRPTVATHPLQATYADYLTHGDVVVLSRADIASAMWTANAWDGADLLHSTANGGPMSNSATGLTTDTDLDQFRFDPWSDDKGPGSASAIIADETHGLFATRHASTPIDDQSGANAPTPLAATDSIEEAHPSSDTGGGLVGL